MSPESRLIQMAQQRGFINHRLPTANAAVHKKSAGPKHAHTRPGKVHEERTLADAPCGARAQGTASSYQTCRFCVEQRLDARASCGCHGPMVEPGFALVSGNTPPCLAYSPVSNPSDVPLSIKTRQDLFVELKRHRTPGRPA